MANIKYWSKAKKLDYCKRIGVSVAETLFKDFGPDGNSKFKGSDFVYPDSLLMMIDSYARIAFLQSTLQLDVYEYIIKEEAQFKIN